MGKPWAPRLYDDPWRVLDVGKMTQVILIKPCQHNTGLPTRAIQSEGRLEGLVFLGSVDTHQPSAVGC